MNVVSSLRMRFRKDATNPEVVAYFHDLLFSYEGYYSRDQQVSASQII